MDILDPTTPVKNSIIIYLLLTMIILHYKPSYIFSSKQRCESFGMCKKNNETNDILTLVLIFTSVLSYFSFLIINVIHNRKK